MNCLVRAASTATEADCDRINGTRCSFYVPKPVTLSDVQRMFPFDGTYHFRAKVSGASVGAPTIESLWLDLTDPQTEISTSKSGDTLEILALALSLPNVDHDENLADVQQYLDSIRQEMPELADRPKRQEIKTIGKDKRNFAAVGDKLKTGVAQVFQKIQKAAQKSTEGNLSIESVTAGVTNLWSSIAKQTMGMFNQQNALSDVAEENLAELSDLLGISFMPSNNEHEHLLRDLWDCLFNLDGNNTFVHSGDKWKEAGFQKADPTSDLKQSGILALRAMLHMALSNPEKTQEMLLANKVNTKTKYPFAIVGVNITLLLSELLNLKDNKYITQQGVGYWSMFEDPGAFYEIFCLCFFHMNATWKERQAVRADFGKLISEIKTIVTKTLARNPSSVMDFRMIAIDEGMIS